MFKIPRIIFVVESNYVSLTNDGQFIYSGSKEMMYMFFFKGDIKDWRGIELSYKFGEHFISLARANHDFIQFNKLQKKRDSS